MWLYLAVATLMLARGSQQQQVTCDTEFADLEHSITLVLCPGNCWSQNSTLCGDRVYCRGPVCLAAMHDQQIDVGGGPVTVYRSSGDRGNHYNGEIRNAVTIKSCYSDGDSYSFEMTCSTQGKSSTPVTEVLCPAHCDKYPVYGSGIYSSESSVCSAAIHAGNVTAETGGWVTFYKVQGMRSYPESTANGITSLFSQPSNSSFSFANVDDCKDNKCEKHSTCADGIGEYYCLCSPDFTGKLCQTRKVTPNMNDMKDKKCANNSTCVDGMCKCLPGFTGELCQTNIDECEWNQCENNATCKDRIGEYSCICPQEYTGKYCEYRKGKADLEVESCWKTNSSGNFTSLQGGAVCYKGWLVLQQRFDGGVDFQKSWRSYKEGFYDVKPDGEFWWGLKKVYQITRKFKCSECRLRVELVDFKNNRGYADYSRFRVASQCKGYSLCVGGYTPGLGEIGDSFASTTNTRNVAFSTDDRSSGKLKLECPERTAKHGGWWFRDCSNAHLNGKWLSNASLSINDTTEGMRWPTWGNSKRLKSTRLMFRCKKN